jgi:phage/plasmid-like protein (TIGR03299 family)
MAHELHINETGKASMAYKNAVPWHGLGQDMGAEKRSIEEWTEASGMNFEIILKPVQYTCGIDLYEFPHQKVLHRSDNNAPLAVVSDRFKVVQPKQVMEFYRDLTEIMGFEMETAGVLFGGKKIWALAKIGQQSKFLDDELIGYLLLATANDGTMATTAAYTSHRPVCWNTLSFAMQSLDTRDAKKCVKVSHKSHFDADAVKAQLGIASTSWETFMKSVDVWSNTRVMGSTADKYFSDLLAIKNSEGADIVSKRIHEQLLNLYHGAGIGSQMDSAKGTVWGLINAVTEYVDHHKGRSADTRMDNAMFGTGSVMKDKAVALAAELV